MTPLLQAVYVHLTFKVALVGNFARRANVANPVCVGLGPRVLLLRRAEFRIRRQVWRRSHGNVHGNVHSFGVPRAKNLSENGYGVCHDLLIQRSCWWLFVLSVRCC